MQVLAARKLAEQAKAELEREPKINYDQMRFTLETLALNVEEHLGRY